MSSKYGTSNLLDKFSFKFDCELKQIKPGVLLEGGDPHFYSRVVFDFEWKQVRCFTVYVWILSLNIILKTKRLSLNKT